MLRFREGLSAASKHEADPAISNKRAQAHSGFRPEILLRQILELSIPPHVKTKLREVQRLLGDKGSPADLAKSAQRILALTEPFASSEFCAAQLESSLRVLPGMGPKRVAALAKSELRSVSDLLFRFPTRYDDRRVLCPVAHLQVGQHVTFVAEILEAQMAMRGAPKRWGRGKGPRQVLEALAGDGTGTIQLVWFRAPPFLRELVVPGTRLRITGDVRRYRFAKQISHPEIERLEDGGAILGTLGDVMPTARERDLRELREIVPDYGTPGGLPPRIVRELFKNAVAQYADLVPAYLPESIVNERKLPAVGDALRGVHAPAADADLQKLSWQKSKAHERLILEEFFLLECGLALRNQAAAQSPGIAITLGARAKRAAVALPFQLTAAQHRVVGEIWEDLGRPHPMHRLLQGDVGSGKTAVAFLTALAVAEAGYQTALMAPTEILAEQHAHSLAQLAESGGATTRLRLALLTASAPRAAAEEVRRKLLAGDVDLVVGTHALVQDEVGFARLGLAIVDEQHRFGVRQRAAFSAKGAGGLAPHMLVMTATPIPRTLALTLYGDLDLSVIDELPPGRSPVKTELLRSGEGQAVMSAIRETLARGEQVYIVYPLVEESEKLDLRSAVESAQKIAAAFPKVAVEVVHGQLDAEARGAAMQRFKSGKSAILVSTTVIEVGVDVANATLMVIEHAERFGLAQLHQLRGRVGRGSAGGRCLLIARQHTKDGEARLRAMLETTDGFRIADADLKIRGPGEFLGTQQSGRLPELHMADLLRDARLIPVARSAAFEALRRDPGLRTDRALARAVEARWGDRLALAKVG